MEYRLIANCSRTHPQSIKWTHEKCTETVTKNGQPHKALILLTSPPKTIDIPCGYGPDKFAETDRECIEEDYSPGFTPCVNGRQAQFQQKLTDCITPCLNYPANVLKRLQTCVQLDAEDPNDNGPIEGCEPLICQKDRQAMRWFHYDCKDLNEYNSLVFYDSPFLVVDIQCELKVEEGKVGFTSMTDAIEAGVEVNIIKDLGVHFAVENVLAKTKVVNRGANSIWTWGNNAYGQLGFPPKVTKDLVNDQLGGIFVANIEKSPKRLPAMDQILFQSACAGETHSCVVTDSGDLYCMGSNYHGQHGQNDFVSRGWPALVTPIQKIGKVKSIACGSGFSSAILEDGTGYCMGANLYGQQAHGDTKLRPVPMVIEFPKPVEKGVTAPPPPQFVLVRAGVNHLIALTVAGDLWGWGLNDWGQLGLGDREGRFMPVQILWFARRDIVIAQVECGDRHTLALDNQGRLYAWGLNSNGQLGLGDTFYRWWPCLVEPAPPMQWRIDLIAAGGMHSLAVTDAGEVMGWGSNREGQLGQNVKQDYIPYVRAKRVLGLPIERGIHVYCGVYHNLATTMNGSIFVWGWNKYGQLGLGHTDTVPYPVLLHVPGQEKSLAAHVAMSESATIIVFENGEKVPCGNNRLGQYICGWQIKLADPITSTTRLGGKGTIGFGPQQTLDPRTIPYGP